ncbi:MAG TPA: hypothetical protein VFP88_07385 [Rhodanobacteraceae bacterium]|nr:hypothetical protein [Rhodanobacteraceae bacterium]
MKTQRPVLTLLCASLLSVFAAQAIADDGTTTTTTTGTEATRLANRYTTFAGSESNAEALVNALRNGTEATLDSTTTTTVTNPDGTTTTTTSTTPVTFQPATGKLGWGNVNIALALAQDELNQMGITDPTADQIEAVLNGGTLTSTDGTTSQSLQGVLALRAEGEGWGQIANTLGFKLGDVVSASNNNGHSQAGAEHGSKPEVASSHPDKADHPVRPEHPDHPQRPDRPDRPQRPDRPDHVGRPGG